MRRKRTGVGDDSLEARLQGRVAQPPRVTLTSLRKLYDLLGDGITCRTDDPVRMLEGHKGHLKSQAQETSRLRIEPMALQMLPHRHGSYVNSTVRNLLEEYSHMHGIATNRGDRGVLSLVKVLA